MDSNKGCFSGDLGVALNIACSAFFSDEVLNAAAFTQELIHCFV